MTEGFIEKLRSGHDGPPARVLVAGMVRVGVLLIAAMAASRIGHSPNMPWLLGSYAVGCLTSLWYVVALRRGGAAGIAFSRALVAMDFAIVAATVTFTGGSTSFFAFLFVVVLLEAGLLLGLGHALAFAIFGTLYMAALLVAARGAVTEAAYYSLLIQGLAFCLSAFLSGYWHQRIFRLQAFQREILDNLNSGFLITNQSGQIVAQNRAADHILHLPVGAAIGRHVGDVLRPEGGGECPVLTTLRSQRDFTSYEFSVLTASGQRTLIGLTTSRIYSRNGGLSGSIASFTDLTEMARMRRELRQQDRMAAVGELAAGLAHEIRNPLAAIRGAVDEIPASIGQPAILERLAAIVIREADHLNKIVTDFLEFARNPMVRRQIFDLRAVLDETVAAMRQRSGNGLVIETSVPDTPLRVSGDPDQIKQVCVNLAKNAADAMNGAGTLAISLSRLERTCEIRFDDEGPGIAPDVMDRIFEPFFTTKERGVGMGLAVCMRIVTAHDGIIHAASRPGGGATVAVRLPVAHGDA